MKHIGLIIYFVCFIGLTSHAQTDTLRRKTPYGSQPQKHNSFSDLKDKLYFAGGLGLRLGTYTYIGLQPMLGVKLTDQLSIGAGVNYNYFKANYQSYAYETTIYGVNTFARYLILDNVFVQAGWDRLNVPNYFSINPDSRAWVDNILIGAGYKQAISDNSSFVMMGFYNINETPLSPYGNPIFQAGINIGF